ncbi:sigma-70 family RNA polymerase sigma factor [Candidatus Poribacteria bacterium]|nr:sigma-70 family RNA polymerase sigma factor [Candidatus Poribacteria bacterium]
MAQIAASDPLPDEIAEQRQREERIRQIVDSLSEKNRLTVVLFYMHDLSHREISNFLDIPVSAVKARLHKARKQLKERLLIMVENEFATMKPKAEFTGRVMLAIRGCVVSADDGSPIADAKVILDGQTHTETDALGNYHIELESGRATGRTLWIEAKGYPTYSERFHTHAEETQVIFDVALDAEFVASISGRLVTADGKPVKKAFIWGRSLPEGLTTDDNGYFRYDGLRPYRRYEFSTKPEGYLRKDMGFTIEKPGHLDLNDIVLKKGKTISGRVTNPQGEPVANASIHAGPGPYPGVGDTHDAKTQTDADGRYILCGMDWEEDGTAYVMVFAKGYGMASQKVKFGDAEKLDGVDFRLEAGAEVRGTVTDDKGKPIEGLRVMVYYLIFQDTNYLGRFGEYLAGETDAEGRFCIKGLPQGEGEIRRFWIHDSDGNSLESHGNSLESNASHGSIEIGTTDAQIVIQSCDAQIAGRVVDAETGQPIPKFTIRLGHTKADNLEEIKKANMYSERTMPKSVELHNAWARLGRHDSTYASADGRFTIAYLPVNAKRCLLVTADGYVATEAGPVEATRQPEAPQLTIQMKRGKRIRGIVTDSESGKPIQGAWVTYFNQTQPYTVDGEILPQRIPTGGCTLPLGGETVCTNKNGEYEITTAQTHNNYLVINAPGYDSGVTFSSGPEGIAQRFTHPLEYAPMVVGPVEVTEDALFLPISFPLKRKT